MKLRAIIIDDEPGNINNLEILLNGNFPDIQIVATSKGGSESLQIIRKNKPDILFLDIEMPGMNGFQLLENLDNLRFALIFVTAYNQYAIRAIKFSAVDYILKPIDIKELGAAIERAKQRINEQDDIRRLKYFLQNINAEKDHFKIALPGKNKLEYIRISDIVRCEADGNYTKFILNNDRNVLVSRTLREFEDMLSDFHFIRAHQSHLVNERFIASYNKRKKNEIILMDGTIIPVSRYRKNMVLERLREI